MGAWPWTCKFRIKAEILISYHWYFCHWWFYEEPLTWTFPFHKRFFIVEKGSLNFKMFFIQRKKVFTKRLFGEPKKKVLLWHLRVVLLWICLSLILWVRKLFRSITLSMGRLYCSYLASFWDIFWHSFTVHPKRPICLLNYSIIYSHLLNCLFIQ